jgi:hypothetical protein
MDKNITPFKSSAQQKAEAERAVNIDSMKAKLALYSEAQKHLSVARKRLSTELSDEKYAASGYTGDAEANLIETINKLRTHSENGPKENLQ